MSEALDSALYQQFRQQLEALILKVQTTNPEGRSLQAAFLELQQFFQQHLQPQLQAIDLDGSTNKTVNLIQSVHTEINKQLRLLGTDVMFFQAARQPMKRQQRQSQMRDRLQTLQTYCDGILAELERD